MAPTLNLITLPPELLIHTIKHIQQQHDLLSLAQCCHRLYQLVLPILYTYISLKKAKNQTRFTTFYLLTYRLLSDPLLASYVRRLSLDEEWDINSDEPRMKQTIKSDFLSMARQHLIAWPEDERKRWIEQVEKGDEDAMAALLFHSVPSLDTLHFVLPLYFPSYGTNIFIKLIGGAVTQEMSRLEVQKFKNLRIIIDDRGPSARIPADPLNYYLRLPSIQEVYMRRTWSEDDELSLTSVKPGSCPTLKHLELRCSSLNSLDLTQLLAACTDLKTFVYDSCLSHGGMFAHDIPTLTRSLLVNTQMLENLWIDYGNTTWDLWSLSIGTLSSEASLRDLRNLKNLRTGMYTMFGPTYHDSDSFEDTDSSHDEEEFEDSEVPNLSQILPISIETIYITHTHGRIGLLARALEELLRIKGNHFPSLREITFEAYLVGNDQAPSLEKLEILAADAHVTLRKIDTGLIGKDRKSDHRRRWDRSMTWAGLLNQSGRFIARAGHH